ncbi:MAG: Asp23/Gls24 family envelope stress response protein [Chloroflexia bacterium]
MDLRSDDSLGRIEVSRRAIAALAEQAALQCYGVVGLVSRHRQGVWVRPPEDRGGVVVRLDGDRVILELYVVIEYGTRICEVARNVMASVRFAVEHTLGVPVEAVHVFVQGIHLSRAQSEPVGQKTSGGRQG